MNRKNEGYPYRAKTHRRKTRRIYTPVWKVEVIMKIAFEKWLEENEIPEEADTVLMYFDLKAFTEKV